MRKLASALAACLLVTLLPAVALAGPVNINTADAATLSAELTGVGMAKAEAIIAYREANGPFRSVDDLARVKGIGSRTLEMNRGNIRLELPEGKRNE